MMKRSLFITILLIALAWMGTDAAAQKNDLSINLEVSDPVVEGEGFILVVEVRGGQGDFTYMLFEDDPMKGVQPVQTEKKHAGSEYRFNNLPAGTYHVCVMDRKDNMACKKTKVQ